MEKIRARDKKDFITWFLGKYQFKRRECSWILNYIAGNEKMLDSLHFVDNVAGLENAIIMSTHCVDDIPFKFYKNGRSITDAETAFHSIRLNKGEDLYIQLNAFNLNKEQQYYNVLEENHMDIPTEFKVEAEKLINRVNIEFSANRIKHLIDKALDERNEEEFLKYSSELKKLQA